MHDDLRSNIQNPSQNFYTNSLILKNPQKFFKTQNWDQKEWNAWLMSGKESYQMKNTWFRPKIKCGMWEVWVWRVLEWEKRETVERNRRNEIEIAKRIYIGIS